MAGARERLAAVPADELALLRERAEAVAKAPAAEDTGQRLEVLRVESRRQAFALPLEAVEGVVELSSISAVPRAPPLLRGLVTFRGELMLGIELAALMGSTSEGIADLGRVIAVSAGRKRLALLAEKVLTVESVALASFRRDRVAQLPFVVGTDAQFLSLLDVEALIDRVFSAVSRP